MQRGAYDLVGFPAAAASGGISGLWQSIRRYIVAIDRTLALWHARAESRREMTRLDEQLLKDLRLDAVALNKEAIKPFWRA